jgi:metal-responsive CopG/Arc/MetJ family transcriptional regulator
MKTAISIPDELFRRADEAAAAQRVTRSQFYAEALRLFLNTRAAPAVTERLNAVYDAEPAEVDPVLDALQSAAVRAESA